MEPGQMTLQKDNGIVDLVSLVCQELIHNYQNM